jgi:urease gamma subunit
MGVPEKPLQILMRAGEEIVDTDDMSTGLDELFAKVRAEKSRTAGDKHALFEMHPEPCFRTRQPIGAAAPHQP